MKGYIYKLTCPIKREPIYVGKTTRPETRKNYYNSIVKASGTPVALYIKANKIIPLFQVVEEIEIGHKYDHKLSEAETKWINKLLEAGFKLYNVCQTDHKTEYHREYIRLSSITIRDVRNHINNPEASIAEFIEQAVKEKLQNANKCSTWKKFHL